MVLMTREELLRWIPADNEAILMAAPKNPKHIAALEVLIKQAIAAYTSPTADRFLSVRITLAELFRVMTVSALEEIHESQEDTSVQMHHCRRACAYITAHLSQPLSVSAVADALGISANYLSKLFTPAMHMSVTEYIHRAKMQQVAHLITDGEMTLSEAAEATGIGDNKYLSRLFRRYMGMSAAQYKKHYR
jgi:AraC-like DNA-binding protein